MLKSREHFTYDQKPLASDWVEKYEGSVRQKIEAIEKNPELVKFLEKVDFQLLKLIFLSYIRKTDIDPTSINLIEPDRIVHEAPKGSTGACYSVDMNFIALDYDSIKSQIWKGCFPEADEEDIYLILLWVLMHEESHAVSKSTCFGVIDGNEPPGLWDDLEKSVVAQAGYELHYLRLEDEKHEHFRLFNRLDEGINEKLAREIFRRYVESSTFAPKSQWKKFLAKALVNSEILPRADEVELVDILLWRISRLTGLEEQFIWESIIRGKLEGETVFSEAIVSSNMDIQEALSQAGINNNLLEDLAFCKNTDELKSIVSELLKSELQARNFLEILSSGQEISPYAIQ